MYTIKDIAAKSGVSAATVSRVINNSTLVKAATRERVLRAIEECDYTPNELARSFRNERSGAILVIIPDISNVYYARVIKGVEAAAHACGCSVLLCDTSENSAKEQDYLRLLDSKMVSGLILMTRGHTADEINALCAKCPVVQCSEYLEGTNAPYIAIDNRQAAADSVRHLINQGHRRIGLIGSRIEYHSALQREQGYLDALEKAGIVPDDMLIRRSDYSYLSGMRLTKQLFRLPEPPTAVFCIADTLAIGALKAARRAGLSVPEQFAVVGFDNTILASMYDPTITSVSQSKYEMGYKAMELLQRLMDGQQDVEDVLLEHELVIRESTVL